MNEFECLERSIKLALRKFWPIKYLSYTMIEKPD